MKETFDLIRNLGLEIYLLTRPMDFYMSILGLPTKICSTLIPGGARIANRIYIASYQLSMSIYDFRVVFCWMSLYHPVMWNIFEMIFRKNLPFSELFRRSPPPINNGLKWFNFNPCTNQLSRVYLPCILLLGSSKLQQNHKTGGDDRTTYPLNHFVTNDEICITGLPSKIAFQHLN